MQHVGVYLPVRALGARFLGSSDNSLLGLPPPPTSRCLLGLREWLARLGSREYGFRASCNKENIKSQDAASREGILVLSIFEREYQDKAAEREFNFGQSLGHI